MRTTESLVARMVRQHSSGTEPAERTLDTPEKIQEFIDRMRAATEEQAKDDRRAAALSWLHARDRVIL